MSDSIRGAALFDRLRAVRFDERDAWLDALLGFEAPPPDVDLPRGAVPYLPSGVDAIVAMVREAPLRADGELVDVGAGLGRAVIVAHLLSGARACGVELQAPLVERARGHAARLGLTGVSFVCADAAATALDGSVFFLYAPCNGAMLAAVLARIEAVARRRAIVVAAVDLELDVPWLAPRASSCPSLTLYDSQ